MNVLVQAAQQVRQNAYAPYSVYRVGAAILGADGKVYVGCNVENVSFGLTVCAERNALGRMVADGCTEIAAVAVATRDGGTPCGMCRQSLWEFAPEPEKVRVRCVAENGSYVDMLLAELLPGAFESELKKK